MAGKNKPKTEKGLDMTKTETQTEKTRKPRTKDTRPGDVIFGDRAFAALNIMGRQHAKLRKLGTARNAAPTEAQVQKIADWLDEQTTVTLAALRAKLAKGKEGTTGEKPQPQNFLL